MTTPAEQIAKNSAQSQISSFFIDKIGQIWVSAYGAKGDGISDDTKAVQDAVNAAITNNVKEVYFVSGKTYKITSLSNTAGLTFIGDSVTITGGASISVISFSSYKASVDSQLADNAINVKHPLGGLAACVCDGVTDDSAAFNAIYQYAYENGKDVYIPGKMKINSSIGLNVTLTGANTFPSIIGDRAMGVINGLVGSTQGGSMILYEGVGEALRIKNYSSQHFFFGGLIRDIAIIKKNGITPSDGSIGLSMKGCIDYRLYNVSIIGFNIGFKNDYGWSWDTFGLACKRNTIGVLLEDNSNAVGLHGSQLHQNKVNIKIVSGTNITINKATLEGLDSIGVVITKGTSSLVPSNIKMSSLYFESNDACFKIGKDENDVQSAGAIVGVSIDNANLEVTGIVPFELDNVVDVSITNIRWGQTTPLFNTTAATQRVSFNGFWSQFESDIGDRYSAQRRIGVFNRVNLLPNGFLDFPDLTSFKRGGLVAEFDTTTFPGEKVVKITVPTGTATNVNTRMIVKVDPKMIGKKLLFSGTAQKDSGLTASFATYTSAFSGISGASVVIPTVLSKAGFYFNCPNDDYINLSIVLANSSGETKYCYIKSMVLVENGVGEVEPNPLDYLSALSGAVAGTTTGVVVPLPGWSTDMYEVIATPRANVTAYVTKAANQFTITTVGGNGTVAYLIIPKCGMFI